jgi:uncharacterized protein YkwD
MDSQLHPLESRRKMALLRRFVATLTTTWLVAVAACGSPQVLQEEEPLEDQPSVQADEVAQATHVAVNAARADAKLLPLAFDRELAEIATRHARDMAERRYFDHASPEGETLTERMVRGRYRCEIVLPSGRMLTGAENLAMIPWAPAVIALKNGGRRAAETRDARGVAQEAVRGWLDSPGHRANLLHAHLRSEGLGIWVGRNGQVLLVQVFC